MNVDQRVDGSSNAGAWVGSFMQKKEYRLDLSRDWQQSLCSEDPAGDAGVPRSSTSCAGVHEEEVDI